MGHALFIGKGFGAFAFFVAGEEEYFRFLHRFARSAFQGYRKLHLFVCGQGFGGNCFTRGKRFAVKYFGKDAHSGVRHAQFGHFLLAYLYQFGPVLVHGIEYLYLYGSAAFV